MPNTDFTRGLLSELLNAAGGIQARIKAALPPTDDYDNTRADYSNRLFESFISYLSSGGTSRRFENQVRRAITEDFPQAFYRGYADAGGEDTEKADEAWLTARMATEFGFVGPVFDELEAWRESEDFTEQDVKDKAETWCVTLDGVYSEGKLRGNDNIMLTFDGEDGEESCKQCQKYKGARHSAKWWTARDLIRRNGNENFDCGRWENCQHDLYDDEGELYTR